MAGRAILEMAMHGLLTKQEHVEMHKRQRDIEKMVGDLGLKITGFRTDGGSHWRVDVMAPNGRQRPFTFPTRGHDGQRRHVEVQMLRRWRREVMPELDAKEEAGELRPPPEMQSPLALKLGDMLRPPVGVSQIRPNIEVKPPPFKKKGLPLSAPNDTIITKETAVSAQTTPINGHTEAAHPRKKREQMSFSDVMKFGAWMNESKLEGYYTKTDFLEHAKKTLGFRVSEAALDSWLEENNVSMPQRPHPVRQKTSFDWLNDDIAAIALAISESAVPMAHKAAMLAIVDRRTKG